MSQRSQRTRTVPKKFEDYETKDSEIKKASDDFSEEDSSSESESDEEYHDFSSRSSTEDEDEVKCSLLEPVTDFKIQEPNSHFNMSTTASCMGESQPTTHPHLKPPTTPHTSGKEQETPNSTANDGVELLSTTDIRSEPPEAVTYTAETVGTIREIVSDAEPNILQNDVIDTEVGDIKVLEELESSTAEEIIQNIVQDAIEKAMMGGSLCNKEEKVDGDERSEEKKGPTSEISGEKSQKEGKTEEEGDHNKGDIEIKINDSIIDYAEPEEYKDVINMKKQMPSEDVNLRKRKMDLENSEENVDVLVYEVPSNGILPETVCSYTVKRLSDIVREQNVI